MKKIFAFFICFAFCMVNAVGVLAKENEPAVLLPAIVAQSAGQANTVVMWHDINDDGKADFKASYVFKNGKLHLLSKIQTPAEKPVRQINER